MGGVNFVKVLLVLILIILVVILGNLTGFVVLPTAETTITTTTIPTDKESCETLGGKWGVFGLIREERCILPTSDAGKSCTDSNQCESACIGYKCYQWNPVPGGCYDFVENGEIKPICID